MLDTTSLTSLENRTIDGTYQLETPVGATSLSATYLASCGDPTQPVVVHLQPADAPAAPATFSNWRRALRIDHPHILRTLAVSETTLDDARLIYCVTERPEESLDHVLSERALTPDEVRDLLVPALSALDWLHASEFALSSLTPADFLATSDALKLSMEHIVPASDAHPPSSDMSAFGMVLVEALTRDQDGRHQVPADFQVLIDHLLDHDVDTRWTAAQALEHARNPVVKEPVASSPAAPAAPVAPINAVLSEPRDPFRPAAAASDPAAETHPAGTHPFDKLDQPRNGPGKHIWIIGFAAVLLLVIAVVAWNRSGNSTPAPEPAAAEHPAAVTPAPEPTAAPPSAKPSPTTAAGPPPTAEPPVPAVAPRAVESRTGGRRDDGWAVIVASYNSRANADKRAASLQKKSSSFKPEVLETNSGRSRYLIVLGSDLSEDKADALRRRAITSGLPRDTFIKRIK